MRPSIAILALILSPAAAEVRIVADEPEPMKVLAAFLEKNGRPARIVPPAEFQPGGGAAVIMYVHAVLTDDAEQALIDHARRGGRLVVLHHGIASAKMRNRQWLPFLGIKLLPRDHASHPWKVIRGDVQLVNLRPDHYVTSHDVKWDRTVAYTPSDAPSAEQELPAIELRDTEAFFNQVFADARAKTVLLGFQCRTPDGLYRQDRAGWHLPSGKGHIFYFQQGHEARDYEHPAFRQMILNSLNWKPR